MALEKYRIDVAITFKEKQGEKQGYMQVFGVTADSLDTARKRVLEAISGDNEGIGYEVQIRDRYEMDFEAFASNIKTRLEGDPELEGIWFKSGKIYFEKK